MTQFSDATRKKIVKQHIQKGRTLASLAAEYGVSKASISNWNVHTVKNAKQMMMPNPS